MEKKVQIGMLFEIYGNLLTKRQQNILNDYGRKTKKHSAVVKSKFTHVW